MRKGIFCPRVVIAGIRGGSGKTTLSLGLIAAIKKRGLKVTPYKKGPDYIDAGWLSSAAERPCYNLDPFMINKENILYSFHKHYGEADFAVIEGNRGLYDGMDAEGTYSTAELAKMLRSPVILIFDCTKVTRTVAAMISGVVKFDRKLRIKGVVLNQVAGKRHERILRESIEKYCDLPVIGAIPKLRDGYLSERHMGLTPFQEHPEVEKAINYACDIVEKYLDVDYILKVAKDAELLKESRLSINKDLENSSSYSRQFSPEIGFIRDSAFQFYYPENLEELEKRGARLVEISALNSKNLPDIDALYIGGGFPETHAIALSRNKSFRKSLKNAIEKGLPVYAECGGLMYLGKSLLLNSRKYPMVGVFPLEFSLEKRPQAHGYALAETVNPNPFYDSNILLKGHEFHYSRVIEPDDKKDLIFALKMRRGSGIIDGMDGICYKNVLAAYTHVHALGSPEWAEGMIRRAIVYKTGIDIVHD